VAKGRAPRGSVVGDGGSQDGEGSAAKPSLGQLARWARARTERLQARYQRLLGWALDHRALTVVAAVLLMGASLALLPWIGSEFLPPSDEGEVRISAELEVGTRLELVDAQTRKLERLVFPAVPETVASVVTVGASGRRPDRSYIGQIVLALRPQSKRKRDNARIAADLRRRLAGRVAGVKIRVRARRGQFVLDRILAGESGLAVEVRGFELKTLDALAAQAAKAMRQIAGVTDVEITRKAGVPQRKLRINRAKVADVGLSVRDVTAALEVAVAGAEAGEYRVDGDAYRILVQLADVTTISLSEVLDLSLITKSGKKVALRNLLTTEPSYGPLVINRKDQRRLVRVEGNVAGRPMGSVAAELQRRLDQIPRPASYDLRVAGDYEEQQRAFRELLISFALALVLVYMVLASQYESLKSPLVVMLSVPVAGVGVLLALFATGTTLNVQSYIGCIMLGGIVVNNAILLVDQLQRLEAEGVEPRQAALEAGRRRLRPILMTTLTTVLGLLPLALGVGEGADAQAPLARAVLGGLMSSTPITLLLVPAVYLLLRRRRSAS
jgi:HAE1 family hydrophobic/amphiphilic exporter-1